MVLGTNLGFKISCTQLSIHGQWWSYTMTQR
jgi:hypothetical protein